MYCWFMTQITESADQVKVGTIPCHFDTQVCAVVSLLRDQTLSNSPTALRNAILEIHSEEWLRKQLRYLDDWKWYRLAVRILLKGV